MLYRIIPGLVAALLATTAISWLFDPAAAAAGLGMPYLEGIGRSTQVGDFSAFFVFLVVMCIAGVITQTGHYLRSASLLLLRIERCVAVRRGRRQQNLPPKRELTALFVASSSL